MHSSPCPALRPSYVIRHAYSLHNVALSVEILHPQHPASSYMAYIFRFLLPMLAWHSIFFLHFTVRNATQMTIFGEGYPTALQGWKYLSMEKGGLVDLALQPPKR
jgi:hypothetical protein